MERIMGVPILKIDSSKLLVDMYADSYFPRTLVDKVRDVLLDVCREIEVRKPTSYEELYEITCAGTDRINGLHDEFEENGSEIETVARDDIGASFSYIAEVYGFPDADGEELIATRDW
jgi:hypothetical protein